MSVIKPWNRLPRVSSYGDIQNLTGHSPGQSALGAPALRREVGLENLQRTGSRLLKKVG